MPDSDVQVKVPGSMSINATTIFEDGLQIPSVKLYSKGVFNSDLMTVFCRNSRIPEWFQSDVTALVAACRTAATRVCEVSLVPLRNCIFPVDNPSSASATALKSTKQPATTSSTAATRPSARSSKRKSATSAAASPTSSTTTARAWGRGPSRARCKRPATASSSTGTAPARRPRRP